ncbi:MAG: flavodoxin family protein [Candidatus Hodarchaeota archaeon]
MRIAAIVGSNRRGNTYSMVEAGCHALTEAEVELIHLKDLDIQMCDGCLACDESGKCHIDDDMQGILKTILESDGFIFGTPARWSLLSGELKTFFDRLNPLAVPELMRGKKAVIFAVGQTENEEAESIELAANSVHNFCDNAGIDVIEKVIAEGCLESDDLMRKHPDILKECKKAAVKLMNSLTD